ncbi:MAG: efflux RND transporter periplasmic adaptor subunit [Opitutaceae bacterium]
MKSALRTFLFLCTAALSAASTSATKAPPPVNVILAVRSNAAVELVLPASLQAFQEASIYARTGGYLGKWLVDLGDQVSLGQKLAVIDGPELDQELNQARAALAQAKANAELTRTTAARWTELAARNAVSKQEADEKSAAAQARAADVQAAEANVARLTQLKSLQTIIAPFTAVVTFPGAEIGALITTDSSRRELFRIAAVTPLRVFANVPQSYLRSIHPGLEVEVLINEFPGRIFNASVIRAAGAIDPITRTLTTEIQLPNANGELLPGMFVQIRFRLKPVEPALVLPSNAVIIRADGPQVASVDSAQTIRFKKVKIGRDFGTQIEILSGLADGTRVASNPNDTLTEGLVVEPLLPVPAKK